MCIHHEWIKQKVVLEARACLRKVCPEEIRGEDSQLIADVLFLSPLLSEFLVALL